MPAEAPLLLLRADASPEIGFGHVTRCLTLARAWTLQGGRATLMTASPSESTRARAARFGVALREIPGVHPDPADSAALKKEAGAWIAVDGYRFDEAYLSAARATGARVLAIDDAVRLARYDADLVLDQNLGAESQNYGVASLLGVRFVLLRPEFAERARPKRSFPAAARSLLISMGGGDSSRAAAAALDAIGTPTAGLEVVVALGAGSPAPRVPAGVRVERDPDLPALMERADFAIIAGGTTAWEAAYMGLPAIYSPVAENQKPIARALAAAGTGLYAGDASSLSAAAALLSRDPARRTALSVSAAALVDGLGTRRVLDKMLSFSERACS